MITLDQILKAADTCGIAHNGGARGDQLLVGTESQLRDFAAALAVLASAPPPVPATGAGIHALLARDVVEQWPDIDQAFHVLYKQAQGLAVSQWYSARTKAARMYLRATQALGVPVEARALELAEQQTGRNYG